MAEARRLKPARRAALTHVAQDGRARMVDVGDKPATAREAVARGTISMSTTARRLVRNERLKKGDPVEVARLAGIMAAKKTAALIPLCHQLTVSFVDVQIRPSGRGFAIEAVVRTNGPTGVEMEALTAVAVAALTLYDMAKAVDRAMVIGPIQLSQKSGGRSGTWTSGRGSSGGASTRRGGKIAGSEPRPRRRE